MVTAVLAIAILCLIILGLACFVLRIVEAITNTSHEVIYFIIVMLCTVLVIVSCVCKFCFSETLDKETLDTVKERHARMLERCPTEVGECEIKWLDYRADSLRAEYKVQRLKYE